jgi:hypothetical protein
MDAEKTANTPSAFLEQFHKESLIKFQKLEPNKLTEAKVDLPLAMHHQVFDY